MNRFRLDAKQNRSKKLIHEIHLSIDIRPQRYSYYLTLLLWRRAATVLFNFTSLVLLLTICKPYLATCGYRTFSEEKVPKRLSDSIRYALGSAVLRLWVGLSRRARKVITTSSRRAGESPPKHQADTAKASRRDALGSFFGSFCSQKEQYRLVKLRKGTG